MSGVVLSDLNASSLVYANGSKQLVSVANGTAGQVLTAGSGGSVSWSTVGGTGTVTSIGISVPSYLSVSNSPITGAGTIAITSVAGSEGQVLTSTSGSVGWANLPTVNWASPGAIGSTTASTGTFTQIQGNGMVRMIKSYTTIAYVSNAITFTAAQFSTGAIKFTGVNSATTITTDTAVNLVAQFGSVVGSCYSGDFVYVSTGAARAMTWNGGAGVTVYGPTGSNNSYHEHWTIMITSATTIDFYIQ